MGPAAEDAGRRRRRGRLVAALALTASSVVALTQPLSAAITSPAATPTAAGQASATTESPTSAAQAATGPTSFQPISPARLADSRPAGLPAGHVLTVFVTGRAGIPAGATSASLNLTVTAPATAGWLAAYPCDAAWPGTSNLNYAAGQTVANMATVTLGASGKVCVLTSAPAQVIVDVMGWWGTSGQAFGALAPTRFLDTRGSKVRLAQGDILRLAVAGVASVPANATGASVNLTVVSPVAAGFLTAWPCGEEQPGTSNLNYATGQTVANLATVALGGGAICVATYAPTYVIVDVTGWWGPAGLARLQPVGASRQLDTRPGLVAAGGIVSVPIPASIGVAALNLTVANASSAGFLTAFPCGQTLPGTSNLNFTKGQTVAASAFVPPGPNGRVCVFVSAAAPVVVDVFGGLTVANVSNQALGGRLYALQWGYTQMGAPYAAINPYRFGDSTWGKRWDCPAGQTTCSKVDMHGGTRTADAGEWVYDCSGFAVAAYQRAGVDLVRLQAGWSDAMYAALPRVGLDQLLPGDLILFGDGSANPADPTDHVGMFLGGNRMLNATTACGGFQGVCEKNIDWTRVVAAARPPLPGDPKLAQSVPTDRLDPYGGVE